MTDFTVLFRQGGPLMWPILACSILGFALFLERVLHYRAVLRQGERLARQVVPLLAESAQRAAALTACRAEDGPLSRIYLRVLERGDVSTEARKAEAAEAAAREGLLLERSLGFIGTLATLSPLLGLLGTVLGMIQAFQVIAAEGMGTPANLGAGISQALLTTAAGLTVAIPLMLMHRYLSGRLDRLLLTLDGLVQPLLRGDGPTA